MTGTELKHRLAAILAADAAGYSRLMAADERATVAALEAARRSFRTHIEQHQGRVIDMAGDSVLAVFESAAGAVTAALAVQSELETASASVPEDRRMHFRIGVHMGDVIEKADGSVFGDGVNIAARLQAAAPAGGVWVSDAVRGAVKSRVSALFEDQGDQQMKNIAEPVRAYFVRLVTQSEPATPTTSKPAPITTEIDLSLPDKPSIAVLPFTNMSGDPEQEYFTDGVTEDIITELSRFHSLFVIARNSSFTYKGKAVDVRTVGKELGVRYVLEGSIRRSANRIRVTAQLIDALSGKHIWAEKYDRVLEDIFEVQEELTRAIVGAIAPQIESSEMAMAKRWRPQNLSAYELGMRAWSHALLATGNVDPAPGRSAIREADAALAVDPNCTRALMAKAWAHACMLFQQIAPDPTYTLQEAEAAARRAVDTDSSDPAALSLRAFMLFMAMRHDEYPMALADARGAHDLNPNDTFTLLVLTYLEAFVGDAQRALDCGLRALRLNPLGSKQFIHLLVHNAMTAAAFALRRYEEGKEWGLRCLRETPGPPQYSNTILCCIGAGEIGKARELYEQLKRIAPEFVRSRLEGESTYWRPDDRKRQQIFTRIAAGLDDPSAADALR